MKVDLEDAYYHLPVHPDSKKYRYLGFAYESKVYQFWVIPFGPSTAHQVLTRLGHTSGYLHHQGISVLPYLEDWLVHHPDRPSSLTLPRIPASSFAEDSGLQIKCSQVRTGTISGHPVSGHSIMSGSGKSITSRIQSSVDSSVCLQITLPINSVVSSSVPVHAITQLGLMVSSHWVYAPETITVNFIQKLGLTNWFTPLRQSDQSVLGLIYGGGRTYLSLLLEFLSGHFRQIFTEAFTPGLGVHMGNSRSTRL